MLKLVKIKNIANKDIIIKWLISLINESESSYSPIIQESNYPNKEFFILKENNIILPAYISYKNDEAFVLWVHKDYRKKGYAKFMINNLGIRYAIAAPMSIPFWKKIGFKELSSSNRMKRIK